MTKHKITVLASCTAHAIQDGLSSTVFVLLPILAQTFGLSYGQVGMFKAVKSLAQSLLEILSGQACERFGERDVLVFGLLVAGAGYRLLSYAGTPNIILLCFIIIGAGGAYHHAPSSALVAGAFSVDKRRRALGFYNSSGDAGKLIFTALISLATLATISWQTVAFSYGLIATGAAITVFFGLKRSKIGERRNQCGQDITKTSAVSLGWGIIDRPRFFALLATVFLDSMVQAGVLTFVAFAMIAKGVPVYGATLAPVLVLIGGIFGKAVCGFLADRIGVRPAFTMLQGLTAIGLVLVVVAPSGIAYVMLPFIGVVLQGTTSITYVIVNDLVHPERTARGYSMVYGVGGLASVIGPLGFGQIGTIWSIEAALLVMAIIAITAIAPCWALKITPYGRAV